MKINEDIAVQIKIELRQLHKSYIVVEGKSIKPSACYYIGTDPLHILYNTNSPDTLKSTIKDIISKNVPHVEDNTFTSEAH